VQSKETKRETDRQRSVNITLFWVDSKKEENFQFLFIRAWSNKSFLWKRFSSSSSSNRMWCNLQMIRDAKLETNFLNSYFQVMEQIMKLITRKRLTKALFTRDIFAHNIAIKRYCNKKTKDIFNKIFFSVWIENIYFWTIMLIETWFKNILKCHNNILKKENVFYQKVF